MPGAHPIREFPGFCVAMVLGGGGGENTFIRTGSEREVFLLWVRYHTWCWE